MVDVLLGGLLDVHLHGNHVLGGGGGNIEAETGGLVRGCCCGDDKLVLRDGDLGVGAGDGRKLVRVRVEEVDGMHHPVLVVVEEGVGGAKGKDEVCGHAVVDDGAVVDKVGDRQGAHHLDNRGAVLLAEGSTHPVGDAVGAVHDGRCKVVGEAVLKPQARRWPPWRP